MGQLNRAALKAFFETGDKPTQAQFSDFIDSVLNYIDDTYLYPHFIKLLIPSADVLTLFSNPVAFIPPPGPGKFIDILAPSIFVDFNSIPYSSYHTVRFIVEDATEYIFYNANILQTNASVIIRSRHRWVGTYPNSQLLANKGIFIDVETGNPKDGNSNITVYAIYNIIEL